MAIGTILALIFTGITTAIGKAWDATKDFVNWFFSVLPRPLKFFFFLYVALFLVSIIMPAFLGINFTCDSYGNPYKINFIKLRAYEQYADQLASICGYDTETNIPLTELPSFIDMVKNFLIKLMKGVTQFVIPPSYWTVFNDINTTQAELCNEYYYQVGLAENMTRDFVLHTWGENTVQTDYRQVVHIGCSLNNDGEWYQTLKFFNIDIFNFEMWLLIGVIGAIIPFMWKWYSWVHK
jgi:hypothetical protein